MKKKVELKKKQRILATEKAFQCVMISKGKDIKQQEENRKQCCRTVKLGEEG